MNFPLKKFSTLRVFSILTAITALITIYMFQRYNYANGIAAIFGSGIISENAEFIVNRTIRLCVNDLAVILLLFSFFNDRNLLKVAFLIQLFEMLIILPIYFYFKLQFEGPSEISSPLLSFVHRIVVNPIILLLLIPAYWFQKKSS